MFTKAKAHETAAARSEDPHVFHDGGSAHGPAFFREAHCADDGWISGEALIKDIANQHEQALAMLYDHFGGFLFSLARRITGNEREAEEALQDAFLSIWRNAGKYNQARASAATWLITIVRHKSLDRLRASYRRLPSVFEPERRIAEVTDHAPDPARTAENNDRFKQVAAWMDELPPKQRLVIELAFFEGLTHPEIAAQINESIGTVKSRIRIGLDQLRRNCPGGKSSFLAPFTLAAATL